MDTAGDRGLALHVGLTLIGLDFAIFFAVFSALLVVIPYFGAILGAIPVVLFALADSPGTALAALIVYIVVQQIEQHDHPAGDGAACRSSIRR